MVLLPGCKCCGPCWKCYSDGTDFECVGPEDTAPDGWLPVGKCHATEDKCKESCVPCWKCYLTNHPPPQCKDFIPVNLKAVFSECTATATKPQGVQYEEDIAAWINSIILVLDRSKGKGTGRDGDGWNFECDLITPESPPTDSTCESQFWADYPYDPSSDPSGRFVPTDASLVNLAELSPDYSPCKWLFIAPFNKSGVSKTPAFLTEPKDGDLQYKLFAPRVPYNEDGWGYVMELDLSQVTPGESFEIIRELESIINDAQIFIRNDDGKEVTREDFKINGKLIITGEAFDVTDNPDLPPMVGDEYQCFDAQPDEEGWIATGYCHDTKEECAESCLPEDPTTPPGARTMTTTKTTGGPGTELSKLLQMIGINAKEKGCGCKSHAKRMNREGPQWCRDNIETILGWLQTEAKKRKLPFVKAAAKQVVLLAIRKSEK